MIEDEGSSVSPSASVAVAAAAPRVSNRATSITTSQPPTTTAVTLSPFENVLVGAVGGALETCLQMPILTYKFCIQEGRTLPKSVGGWYRGVGVQAGTVAPITALQFAANGMLQSILQTTRGVKSQDQLSNIDRICAAAGAGVISALVYSPVDLITIQQQKLDLNPIQTAKYIVSHYGMFGTSGLYRGFISCAGREAVYTAGYLGLAPVLTAQFVPQCMDYIMNTAPPQDSQSLAVQFTGACIAGTIAAIITHPLDTAKTCIQSDLNSQTWHTARQSMRTLVATHGISSLYRGMIPRTVRLCGAFFVCLLVRDAAIHYKEKHEEQNQ